MVGSTSSKRSERICVHFSVAIVGIEILVFQILPDIFIPFVWHADQQIAHGPTRRRRHFRDAVVMWRYPTVQKMRHTTICMSSSSFHIADTYTHTMAGSGMGIPLQRRVWSKKKCAKRENNCCCVMRHSLASHMHISTSFFHRSLCLLFFFSTFRLGRLHPFE